MYLEAESVAKALGARYWGQFVRVLRAYQTTGANMIGNAHIARIVPGRLRPVNAQASMPMPARYMMPRISNATIRTVRFLMSRGGCRLCLSTQED